MLNVSRFLFPVEIQLLHKEKTKVIANPHRYHFLANLLVT